MFAKSEHTEKVGCWFPFLRQFQFLQPLSTAVAVAVWRRFSAIFAQWLTVAES